MASLIAQSLSAALGPVDQSAHNQTVTLYGRFDGIEEGFTNYALFQWGVASIAEFTAPYHTNTGITGYTFGDGGGGDFDYIIDGTIHGVWTQYPSLSKMACDTTYLWRARCTDDGGGSKNGGIIYTKTYAITPVSGTLSSSSVDKTTATIACTAYYVNTSTSTASVWLEFKKATDSTWTTAGAVDTGKSGYGSDSISRNLTGLTANTAYYYRFQMTRTTVNETSLESSWGSFTTLPDFPSVSTDATTSITYSTATLNGYVTHNTFDGNAYFKYGTDNPPTQYTTANQYKTASGSFSQAITGLTSSTTYYVRAYYAYSGGTVQGAVVSFATAAPPPTPDITTGSASSVTATTAYLNATVNPNGIATTYYFQYGLTTAYALGSTASQGPSSASSPFAFNQQITGLTAGATTYHFRAVANVSGTLYYGADASFATETTPEQYAVKEAHVNVYEYDRIYGVQTTVYFPLVTPSATTSDTFLPAATADPFQATDCQISMDGGDFAATTNLAVKKFDWLYGITLTAAEMAAEDVWVVMHDANATAYRDLALHVRTKIQTGQITANADNIATNTDALVLVNNGIGKAINATGDLYTSGKLAVAGAMEVGGGLAITGNHAITGNLTAAAMTLSGALTAGTISATTIAGVLSSMVLRAGTCAVTNTPTSSEVQLDASASASTDYYKGAIVAITSGTGSGQARQITAYNGTTKKATLSSAWLGSVPTNTSTFLVMPGQEFWTTSPGAELTTMPTYNSTYGQLLQFIFQRFGYPRAQNATTQILYRANGSTVLAQGTFAGDASEQEIGMFSTP